MINDALSLVTKCAVSFRSVPKILKTTVFFDDGLSKLKIPHFTTIIRWMTRFGYYLLKRSTKKICSPRKPWVCVADHTIQVGTNKAFVVIGIPVDRLKLGRALTLNDATVLATAVKTSWTGENVSSIFRKVFNHNGSPLQIVIDGAPNLKKGVREVLGDSEQDCHVSYDITHFIAKLLKEKYGGMRFHKILNELAIASKRIAQTDIGYLLPPKIREKSRFLNFPNLANWFDKVINIKEHACLSNAEKRQVKKYFGWMWKPKLESYIRIFIKEVKAIKDLQKILKNTGINEFSYQKACSKLSEIDDESFTEQILRTLTTELECSKQVGHPLLLTSDLIESLFGKHKTITKPHRLSEISRSVLSIPVVCEEITPELIDKAFSKTSEKEVARWVKRQIPTTLLSRKRKVMKPKANNVSDFSEYEAHNQGFILQAGQKTGVSF